MTTTIAFMSTDRTWAFYLVFSEIADRLNEHEAYNAAVIRSNTLEPVLRQYDRAVVHWMDHAGFTSQLWDDIKDYTWVNASGPNYHDVPWERIPNVLARGSFMNEQLPFEADVVRAGIDPLDFYPTTSERVHRLGTAANQNKIDGRTEGIEKYDMFHHDGYHGEFLDRAGMRDLYNSIETYCSLTDFEAGGNTIIEAAACGCGVVSTDVGFACELDGVEIIDYDPTPEELDAAAERAEPFVDEILADWTWEDVMPEWIDALDL